MSNHSPRNITIARQLTDLLIAEHLLSPEQGQQLLADCQGSGQPFLEVLWKKGWVDEMILAKTLSHIFRIQFVDASDAEPQPQLRKLLPDSFLIRHKIFPLLLDETEKRLEILTLEPNNVQVLDEVTRQTGFRVIPRLTAPSHLLGLLGSLTPESAAAPISPLEGNAPSNEPSRSNLKDLQREVAESEAPQAQPIIQLVNTLLAEAVKLGASDVHFESHKDVLIVRFRIDGILRDVKTIGKQQASAVISRIKVTAGMDISERRRPQDGRILFNHSGFDVDMRVNSLAVKYGESVVIRLLQTNQGNLGLEKLSLTNAEVKQLMRLIQSPNGIILVTGPTGSGKTSTLYSILREINNRERKIITIEDPIEYPLAGINQTQISAKAGLTFASSLKAILRQDPDVILVGEIRDRETLDASLHAALTGHLVFSTIHTNNAVKTITRLREMGAASYMVSSAVVCIIAQRLVRRICEPCKVGYQANPEELKVLGFQNTKQAITLYKGAGCPQCEFTGYKGRLPLFEILEINREIQELIDTEASPGQILDSAIQSGMTTLSMDGERKISAGLTTVDEVTRVLGVGW